MKIILATPLYPPDIAEPAPFIKELATRLKEHHEIAIVTYGHLPEKIPGVTIRAVDKRQPLFVRLFQYTVLLFKSAKKAEFIFAENGASVELPVALVTLFLRRPLLVHIGDQGAHARASSNVLLRAVERLAHMSAHTVLTEGPLPRPEILPFAPEPRAALDAYEVSWEKYLEQLEHIFTHGS